MFRLRAGKQTENALGSYYTLNKRENINYQIANSSVKNSHLGAKTPSPLAKTTHSLAKITRPLARIRHFGTKIPY
jgi:hypothetical protein